MEATVKRREKDMIRAWHIITEWIVGVREEYAEFSKWERIEAWRTVGAILGVSVFFILGVLITVFKETKSRVVDSPVPLPIKSPVDIERQELHAQASSPSQAINVLIPIFRNLTQTKEQISLPAEACGQELASQPPMRVDRFSADARNLLETALTTRAEIPVVKRERLAQAVCEMELGRSGLVDQKTAAKLGKLVGATVQVEGTIDNIRVNKHTFRGYGVQSLRTTVTARLSIGFVSIETGALLFSKTLEGKEENVSTSFGSMDDNDMVAAAIRNAIDNFDNIDELKSKLARQKK
jgi:curli biogenesis system outer membrane secretion channel CsgG